MNDYQPTPRLTDHAKDRCAEMGISTKVAKQIVRHPSVVRPGKAETGCRVVTSDRHPRYAVVLGPEEDPVIVTVLFNTPDFYKRNGATYEVTQ